MWSVSCSQARKRQWTVPLQVNCADVYAQNPTMETINAAIVRVFLYPFVVLRTYTACLKAWTLRTTFQGFHWIFSAAPRLPHEVRVCNHLMLCSFGQQNQDMIIRGLNVFCLSGNRGGVDEWNRIGAPKFHWFPTKIQNSSMIIRSMFLQGSRIQDTHNVYYYDAPLTFKDVQRIYHISPKIRNSSIYSYPAQITRYNRHFPYHRRTPEKMFSSDVGKDTGSDILW